MFSFEKILGELTRRFSRKQDSIFNQQALLFTDQVRDESSSSGLSEDSIAIF
jgi:hypothetical protein